MRDSEVLYLGLAERWVALGRARRWELLAQAEAAHAWRGAMWGRGGHTQPVEKALNFLHSPSYITGTALVIDEGLLVQ